SGSYRPRTQQTHALALHDALPISGHAGVGAGRTEAVCARAHNPAVRGNPEVGRHPAAPVAPFSAGRAVECPAVRGGYGWRGSVARRRAAGIGIPARTPAAGVRPAAVLSY